MKNLANLFSRSRLSWANLAIFVLVFAGIGGYLLLQGHAAGSTANLFVAPNGSDSGANCKRFATAQANPDPSGATDCATWGQAWQLACGGDTIFLESGTFGGQQLTVNTACNKGAASPVTFEPDSSATVTLNGQLTFGANNGSASGNVPSGIVLNGLNQLTIHGGFYSWYNGAYGSNITLENFHVWHTEAAYGNGNTSGTGGAGDIDSLVADNVTVSHVEFGPICCNASGFDTSRPAAATRNLKNIVFDHNNFHDIVRDCSMLSPQYQAGCSDVYCPCHHVDGLHMWAGDGVTITNNKWLNTSGQVIFMENTNCGSYSNVLIENNMMSTHGAEPAIPIGANGCTYTQTNPFMSGYVKILYNTFMGGAGLNMPSYGTSVYSNATTVIVAGNIGNLDTPCTGVTGNWVWDHNLWVTGSPDPACPGDLPQANPGLVSSFISNPGTCPAGYYEDDNDPTHCWPNSWDLHLATGSPAIDQANTAYCPPTDIDDQSRPAGAACDAGADEFGATGGSFTPGDLNQDGKVDVVDLSILLSHYAQAATASQGDINADGKCDVLDLSILLSNYGK